MNQEVSLEGYQEDKYFARSWRMLTMDGGWIKPVLLLSILHLVPVVGPIVALGYAAEWARLTAWGVNSAPKQSNIDWGACLSSGFRAFIIAIGWGAILGFALSILMIIPVIGPLVAMVAAIAGFIIGTLITVAQVRGTIYQQIGAGFKAERLWEMLEHDFGGILRITGIKLLFSLIISIIVGLVITIVFASGLPAIIELIANYNAGHLTDEEVALAIVQWIVGVFPWIIVISVVILPFTVVLELISFTAVGLWYRQFNVPAWGRSDDPLPPFIVKTYEPYYGANYNANTVPPESVYTNYNKANQYQQYQAQTYQPQSYEPPVAASTVPAQMGLEAPTSEDRPVKGPELIEAVPLSEVEEPLTADTQKAQETQANTSESNNNNTQE